MSTTVLNHSLDLTDVDTELKPLEFAVNEAPQFIGQIVSFITDAISATAGKDGIVTHHIAKADLGDVNGEGTTLEELVAIRDRAVAA